MGKVMAEKCPLQCLLSVRETGSNVNFQKLKNHLVNFCQLNGILVSQLNVCLKN